MAIRTKKLSNRISDRISRALDTILLTHPVRTSLGVLLGLAFSIMVKIFEPSLEEITWIDLKNVSIYEYLVLGIVITHISTLRLLFSTRTYLLDENIEKVFNIIKEAKKENIPDLQIGKLYLKVCEIVLKKLEMNSSFRQKVDESKLVETGESTDLPNI